MINKERLKNNFLELVKIPSPSLKERVVADVLKSQLISLGLEVFEDEAGKEVGSDSGNIIGILHSENKNKVLFSAHMDTVLPCEKITPVIDGDIIKTDGTSVLGGDDKAGIAAIIEMLTLIKENNLPHPEIVVIFSISEEIGLKGAKLVNDDILKDVNYGFVIDSGGKAGIATIAAPYSAKGKIEITGKSSHAGKPEKGINAFVVASHAVSKLTIGKVNDETTCNIGTVSGGTAVNIVMEKVEMMFEARSQSLGKLEELLEKTNNTFEEVCKSFGAKLINEVKKGTSGYNLSLDSGILKLFENACKNTDLEFKAVSSQGGSDANVYNSKGIPTLNLSVGMSEVHTVNEFININDIADCTKLILELVILTK